MPSPGSKLAAAIGALALLWIVVYWAWRPAAAPRRVPAPMPRAALPEPAVPAPVTVAAPSPSVAVVPPQFREHTVAEGETLADISRLYFETPDHVEAISRSNPLASLTPLRPGRVIRVPLDPLNMQGLPVAAATPQPPPALREYVVRPGDSLTKIAFEQYGEARHAAHIFAANRDVLKSEDAVRAGQRLRLPPLPPVEGPKP